MAMGIDEAGQQDDFAKVEDFFSDVWLQIRPRADGADPVFRNNDGTIFDGWPGNRQNRSGAKNHGNMTGDNWLGTGNFRGGIISPDAAVSRIKPPLPGGAAWCGRRLCVSWPCACCAVCGSAARFFCDAVNRSIQIAFDILGKQVRPANAQADRAAELFFGHAGVIMFEGHSRVHGAPVKMVEFVQPGQGCDPRWPWSASHYASKESISCF